MTGKERLTFLAQKLRENAANPVGAKFDLGTWIGVLDEANPISCGTTACAFGFATLLPEFKAEGLGYFKDRASNWFHPTFEGEVDCKAAMSFFNISRSETFALFYPESYPEDEQQGAIGELVVAEKIYKYLAGKDITPEYGPNHLGHRDED